MQQESVGEMKVKGLGIDVEIELQNEGNAG